MPKITVQPDDAGLSNTLSSSFYERRMIDAESGVDYLQKSFSRRLPKGDEYTLWRRVYKGRNTYLVVIWHKWQHSKDSSGELTSAQQLKEWTLERLKSNHHRSDVLDLIRDDFDVMTKDPDFLEPNKHHYKSSKRRAYQGSKREFHPLRELYVHLGDLDGHPIYLGDGVWLHSDGSCDGDSQRKCYGRVR